MSNDRIPRTLEDTKLQLTEQLGFLHKSCREYDQGDESEAKRIATALRILLVDTKKMTSLLTQLGQKCEYLDTSYRAIVEYVADGDDPQQVYQIPRQDLGNLKRIQKGLHSMR